VEDKRPRITIMDLLRMVQRQSGAPYVRFKGIRLNNGKFIKPEKKYEVVKNTEESG
jgi:hypothetical protein